MDKRKQWIDISKGLGIILVIWCHIAIDDGIILLWVTSFTLQIFLFLSGYVFKNNCKPIEYIKRKAKAYIGGYFILAVPMFMFTVAMGLYQKTMDSSEFFSIVVGLLIQKRYWVLWYLPCLFWVSIIFYFIIRLLGRSQINVALVIIILYVCGIIYYKLGGEALPWNFDTWMTSLPFFYFGYLIKNRIDGIRTLIEKKWKVVIMISVCIVINIGLTLLSYRMSGEAFNVNDCTYGFAPFTFVAAIAGVSGTVLISTLMRSKIIEFIGRNSLIFFAWHEKIMIHLVNRILKVFGVVHQEGWSFPVRTMYWVGVEILIILGLSICAWLINCFKTKYKTETNRK